MTDFTRTEFFTAHQKRLLRFASLANVFVWIVLVVTILLVIAQLIGQMNIYNQMAGRADFWKMLTQGGLDAFRFIMGLLATFIQGVALALILRGVALALNMIVETDFNYRSAASEEAHE